MLNIEHFILLAGRPAKWNKEIRQQPSRVGDQKVGINLPELQQDQHDRDRHSVEVVKRAYGSMVRCASGPDNFQLVAGSRHDAHWPGTYAAAAAWGINWANDFGYRKRGCVIIGVIHGWFLDSSRNITALRPGGETPDFT